jgi:hypothetical protein
LVDNRSRIANKDCFGEKEGPGDGRKLQSSTFAERRGSTISACAPYGRFRWELFQLVHHFLNVQFEHANIVLRTLRPFPARRLAFEPGKGT